MVYKSGTPTYCKTYTKNMQLELQDVLFLVLKHMQSPSDNFDIFDYMRFKEYLQADCQQTKKAFVSQLYKNQ